MSLDLVILNEEAPNRSPPFAALVHGYRSGEFPKIPIIRIWGAADETGQKVSVFHAPSLLNTQVCCHVHGVYPYCYIEYNRNLIPDEGNYRPFMPKNY